MGWDQECLIFKSLQEFNVWRHEIESYFVVNNNGDKCYDYIYIKDEIVNDNYKLMFISHPDAQTDYAVLVELKND